MASYLKLVEIQTKVASFFPFLGGTLFTAYRFGTLDRVNVIVMLGSLLSLDMATTALNNYMDFKRAAKRHGYGYEVHNAIVRDGLKESWVVVLLLVLAFLAIALGIVLVLRSSWLVLLLGGLSFIVAFIYSSGPLPLSRTPLGEIFSGIFMGLVIPFISVIIHTGNQGYFNLEFSGPMVILELNWKEALTFLLFFAPMAAGIANIMLANNICDIDDDRENQRATIPVLMGERPALLLWCGLYVIGFLAVLAGVVLGLLPWWMSLFFLALFFVLPRSIAFIRHREKAKTFVYSVQNFVFQAVLLCLLVGLGLILHI